MLYCEYRFKRPFARTAWRKFCCQGLLAGGKRQAKKVEKRENFSKKRTAILNALQETKVHPTADWVYSKLKPRYPDLSLGTVYRNLKKFCETGKASSVGVINGQEHFDGDTSPHAHFVCAECGSVIDVSGEFFGQDELDRLSQETELKIESATVLFRGLCPVCRKENPVS